MVNLREFEPLRIAAGKPPAEFSGWSAYLSQKMGEALADGSTFLDVGGGFNTGHTKRILEDNPSFTAHCVDLLDRRENIPSNLIYTQGDACSLPFKTETFDGVYSKSFFSHVWDQDLALDEQARILKEGGTLLLMDESLLNPERLFDWLIKWPIRSDFQYGGLKWIRTMSEVDNKQINNIDVPFKHEVHYSAYYWRKRIKARDDLRLIEITSPSMETREMLKKIASQGEFFRDGVVSHSTYIFVIVEKVH